MSPLAPLLQFDALVLPLAVLYLVLVIAPIIGLAVLFDIYRQVRQTAGHLEAIEERLADLGDELDEQGASGPNAPNAGAVPAGPESGEPPSDDPGAGAGDESVGE